MDDTISENIFVFHVCFINSHTGHSVKVQKYNDLFTCMIGA